MRLTDHWDHAGQPPLSQACVIEVNRDADTSNINTLGSHLLMRIAGGVVSQTEKCLVACLKSRGFHSLTYHVAHSPEAFAASYPGLVDVESVHRSPPPWTLAEGAAILDAFADLPSNNNSASTLTAATAGGRPHSPEGVSSLIGRVHHHVNSGSYLGGAAPKQPHH